MTTSTSNSIVIAVVEQLIVSRGACGVLEQFPLHDGLQHMAEPAAVLRGCGGREIDQGGRQAGIDELQVSGFYHPGEPVPGPNFDPLEPAYLLEYAELPGRRLVIQPDLAVQLRVVAHPARNLRQCPQKPGQLANPVDIGHIADIALNDGVDVRRSRAVRQRGVTCEIGKGPPLTPTSSLHPPAS